MCGILGVYKSNGLNKNQFTKQIESIYHRGPNDSGCWFSEDYNLGLGSRRLSIQDISNNGHMPMTSIDGNYIIVFNGELYNQHDIKTSLLNLGYSFKSMSDTEVVLYAFIAWGEKCLSQFNGMFSIGIFDKKKNEIFLARDRAGEKPLYYWDNNLGFTFSSELKQILLDDTLPRVMNKFALKQYLEDGFTKGKETFVQGVYKLPPAHYLIYKLNNNTKEIFRYWEVPIFNNNFECKSDLIDKLDLLLSSAVKRQMIADVPLGVLLSGGVDSSLITSYAAEISSQKIKTFHISFKGFGKYDESEFAKKVSNFYDTEHVELSGNEIKYDLIDEVLNYFDEPLGDSSMLPTYLVSRLTKKHVTVALGGDGGDELFGGYTTYKNFLNPSKIVSYTPEIIKNGISSIGSLFPIGIKGRNFLINLKGTPSRRFLHNRLFDEYSIRNILSEEMFNSIVNFSTKPYIDITGDLLYDMTKYDFQNYLSEDILFKVDRASMASSLEMRAPWLDKDVIEFAFSCVDSSSKIRGNNLKILPKELLKKRMPIDFDLNRKQGFSVPLNTWISTKWFDNIIKEAENLPSFLNRKVFLQMCNDTKKGYTNSSKIFSLIILSKWIKKYKINY